ncbi:MAG: hypothetical protein QOH06_3629 [Acidobacteriota bacterium]|jgi:hypothetical protein|nr:hypothetical protein [Acidobacteriota bacterium]
MWRRLVRRLRTADQAALEQLCRSDKRWDAYYRDHASWLNRALVEAKGAGRAVFGTFSPTPERESYLPRLDACIFLKPSDYDNSAELKNLVVRNLTAEGEPESASFQELARPLIEKAIRHCEAREIGKLEIELPQKEHALVALFMQLGFRITALRERYIPGQYVCVLERAIGDRYNADPFDLVKLGKWLLRAILPCRVGDPSSPVEDIPLVPFEVHPSHPAFSPQNPTGYAKRLRGLLIILDEGDCEEDNIQQLLGRRIFGEDQLRYVLAHELTERTRAVLTENGITSFDLKEMREIAGGDRSSLSIPMHRSAIGGVLTVLELDRVKEYAEFAEGFVYYLLSGIGSALNVASQVGSILAVFCPSWRDGRSGIVAIAEIEEVTNAPFDGAFSCYPDIPSALTQEDLAFYRTRSDKDRLPVLKCSRMELFQAPVDVDNGMWIASAEERAYLKQELEETNSIYISFEMRDSLRRYSSEFGLPAEVTLQSEVINKRPQNVEMTRGAAGRRTEKGTPSTRILFLSANPAGDLDLEEELRSCERELQGVKFRDSIKFVARQAVRPDDLVRYVREYNPNVLHFSGHSSPTGIVLRSDTGNFQVVEGASLRRFLSKRGIELVVFNACYSDAQAKAVEDVVATVIGTTDIVGDVGARRFAIAFYRTLGNGGSVGEAFRDGRDAVDLDGLSPGLFKSSGNLDLILVRGKDKG